MLRSKLEEIAPSNIFNVQSLPFDLTEQIDELIELQMIYKSAVKEVTTKLEILDDEFQTKHKRNPIHTIQSRVKAPESIFRKLERKGFDISLKSAKGNLFDIAGVRVVCAYIKDIYTIANMLKSQDDITVIRVTDYIKNPKPNGYRSLHLVLRVPVFFSNHTELLPVEVQIRTIAMDFWASLEHQLHYKASEDIPDELIFELKECADNISSIDVRMQNIHNTVDELSSGNDE